VKDRLVKDMLKARLRGFGKTVFYTPDQVWRGCTLRIFAIGDNDPTKNEEIRKGLQKYIYMLRIDADVFRSRSRESGFINDAYNNDDTITSRKQLKL
ncbi:hypothetical protein TELCIR_20861, partial [Teladorsagia circumcincta]